MSNELLYSRFFPPRNGQAWCWFTKYTIEGYIKDTITGFPSVIKYSWQRVRRGWADCDTWSIDCWFCAVMPQMLNRLAEHNYGVPIDFVDESGNELNKDGWAKVLQQMASDLEAHKRFDDRWFGEDGLYKNEHDVHKATQSNLLKCCQEEDAAYDKVKAGLYSFYEYFYSLWD